MFKKLLIISTMACGMAFSYAQEAAPVEKCGCKQGTECTCPAGECACKEKCTKCQGCDKAKKCGEGSGCKEKKECPKGN